MRDRAASVVDRLAGPDDTIAIHGGFDTWIHPAFGARLTRPVVFLPTKPGPVVVPSAAKWVIVDRSWTLIWGNTAFQHMGQFHNYIGRGAATEEDVRVVQALRLDPNFRLVFQDPAHNQAVFERVEEP
jgi:hypothetical protein